MAEAHVYSNSRAHAHMTHQHICIFIMVIHVALNTLQLLPSSINVTSVNVTIVTINSPMYTLKYTVIVQVYIAVYSMLIVYIN